MFRRCFPAIVAIGTVASAFPDRWASGTRACRARRWRGGAQRLGAVMVQNCAARELETEAGADQRASSRKRVASAPRPFWSPAAPGAACSSGITASASCRHASNPRRSTTVAAPAVADGGIAMEDVTIRRRLDGGYTVGPERLSASFRSAPTAFYRPAISGVPFRRGGRV